MLQSPPPPKQLDNPPHPKRCVTAQQPSPAFYWWPVCSEKLKMLRSISPPGLQELKLDLRWGDPRGPMGPWGDGPWILWDDFYFFIKRIRSNMIVKYMNSSSEGSLSRYILAFWIFTCFFSLNSAMFCIVLPLFGSNINSRTQLDLRIVPSFRCPVPAEPQGSGVEKWWDRCAGCGASTRFRGWDVTGQFLPPPK